MVVALINAAGQVDDIRETDEVSVSQYTNVKPVVSDPVPAFNPLEEKLIPVYTVNQNDVTRSWSVVELDDLDVQKSVLEANAVFNAVNKVPPYYSQLQRSFYDRRPFLVGPASGTAAPTVFGGTLTTSATMSFQVTASSTNKWFGTERKRFQTSTTAGNVSGMRTAYGQWYRGSVRGYGGFFFKANVGMQINLNGGRKFIGLCASTGALAGEPSALLNSCGMGYDSTDASTGNWFFIRNNGTGSAVKVDLGINAARNTTDGFELSMFAPAGGAKLFIKIENINTGAVVLEDSYLVKIPAVNTLLAFKAEVQNGAVAAADNIEVGVVYIHSLA